LPAKQEVIIIGNRLLDGELKKAERFLARIRPVLATNDCQFQLNEKNIEFERSFNLSHDQKIKMIKELTAEDCIEIAPNDNPRYAESEVYKFIRCYAIPIYGELENL